MPPPLRYSVDTSAFVDWWVRSYPPKVFAGLVPRVEQLIAEGRFRCSREVKEEIEYENDGLKSWMKAQNDLCIESDEAIQRIVLDLMAQFHNHEKPDKGIGGADPFVIGVAITQTPSPWVVVTGEKPGSDANPKIPWVCKKWGGPPGNRGRSPGGGVLRFGSDVIQHAAWRCRIPMAWIPFR